jgi:hypothetical protein
LYLSPYGLNTNTHETDALIIDHLASRGSDLFVLGCQGILKSFCPSINSVRIDSAVSKQMKFIACKGCVKSQSARNNNLEKRDKFKKIEFMKFEDFLESEADFIQIENTLRKIVKENWLQFEYLSTPVAKFASYDFILKNKFVNNDQIIENWSQFLPHIISALRSTFVANKIVQNIKPDLLLHYNGLYGINKSFAHQFELNNIKQISFHQYGPLNKESIRVNVYQDISKWINESGYE